MRLSSRPRWTLAPSPRRRRPRARPQARRSADCRCCRTPGKGQQPADSAEGVEEVGILPGQREEVVEHLDLGPAVACLLLARLAAHPGEVVLVVLAAVIGQAD